MVPRRTPMIVGAAALALCLFAPIASAQITTGAVTGTVTDPQGGVIPGATVVLISETQGTKSGPVVTNAEGQYTLPNVKADTYTVEVTMSSFKPFLRKGVRVSGGDRVLVEALVLQVGGATENITVTAESPVLQAATGNRSSVLSITQLEDLPVSTHTFLEYITTQVGIDARRANQDGQRTGGGGQDNVMIDGISALDTGNNGIMGGLNLPQQAIAEVKVLTSAYQAEFGRSSGLQVSASTRSGTNRFHGGFYDYERNSDWNANTWARQQNGQAKSVQKERDWGYSVGGPVGKPGGSNKLFFFYTHEYRPRTTGNNTINYRLPTQLERRGDFSETRDNNGNLYNLIYDASTGQPKTNCSTTVQTACFADGGVLGRIPINRLYGPGVAILNQYPLPNTTQTTGSAFNFTTTQPVQKRLSYTPNIRTDYQASQKLRVTFVFNGTGARIVPEFTVNGGNNAGPLPGFSETIQQFPWSFNTKGTVNYTWNNTTFIEGTYGMNQNKLGTPNINPLSNRNNVTCPSDLSAQVANCTMGALPLLFPDSGIVNPGYYEYGALQAIGTPFFQDGRILLQPQIQWGGTRIGNPPPTMFYPGWLNINRNQQGTISLTKLAGAHTYKAGVYIENSYKAQNLGGNFTFQGALNMGVDTNNPLETTYPFSNALLGIFSTYQQGSRFIEGNFHYWNVEWYVQDNWKVTPKMTFDYGARFVHQGPYVDSLGQVANFFPDKWSAANAPSLYTAGCVDNINPCSGNNRQARDPQTGQLLGVGSTVLIGQTKLGTGKVDNGMVLGGNGIDPAGYTFPKLAVAPRFGMAYDLTGQQKIVLRGAIGLYFDRPDGNTAFGTVANPPTATGLQQQWGKLSDLANPAFQFGPVPTVSDNLYNSAIPKDTQWNAGVQFALPWSSSLDVSYVGHHSWDSLAGTQNGSGVNLNAIDVGTTLLASGLDPTQAGSVALNNNLLRNFKGFSNINIQMPIWHRTFHSIQMTWQRRFSHGFSFQANDTWTLYDKGNTSLPGPQLRLIHHPDGTYEVSPDQAIAEDLFADQGTTTHIMVMNGTWDLPDVKSTKSGWKAIGYVVNDWQLSGIFRADSGNPYDLSYSYNTGPTGQALTGSPDYTSRIVINNLDAFGSGCSSDQYAQLNNTMVASAAGAASAVTTAAASGPQVGSHGLESGRNLLHACKNHMLDMAIQRSIRVGGGKSIVIRADLYNAFKTVIFTGRQSQLQFNSTTDMSVRNSQFNPDGSMVTTRLLPNNAGFGAANAARDSFNGSNALRSIQLQVQFRF